MTKSADLKTRIGNSIWEAGGFGLWEFSSHPLRSRIAFRITSVKV